MQVTRLLPRIVKAHFFRKYCINTSLQAVIEKTRSSEQCIKTRLATSQNQNSKKSMSVYPLLRKNTPQHRVINTPQQRGLHNKSSAVAEMGDRGHNRHGPKRGGGVLCPFRGALGTRLIQCGLRGGLLPYQLASSSIQPFGHNSVGCHVLAA